MQDNHDFLTQIRLSHSLSPWRAMLSSLGVAITVIAFALLGEAASAAGPLTPLAIILAGLLITVNTLGYIELSLSLAHPGGAYTLVHEKSGGGALAFITGWVLTLSGLGLCALLAQGAAHHLSQLLAAFLDLAIPAGPLGMSLIALVVLACGLRGWSGRQLPFSVPMIILLAGLVLLAAPRLPADAYPAVSWQPRLTVTMLVAAFASLEITTGHQGELGRRAANLPRTMFGTPVLTVVLGAGLAVVASPLASTAPGTPLAPLGTAAAGEIGLVAVLTLGSIIPLLAMTRTLTMTVQNLYMMSQDGFWPAGFRSTLPGRWIPTRLIHLTGLLIVPLVWMPTALLGQICGLLYLLTMMAVNLTLARHRRQPSPPRFALPFHPWVPALTLAVDLLVIPLWGPAPALWTAVCLAAGTGLYLVYARRHHIQVQEGVTIFHPPADSQPREGFRVLVPIANPATARTLLRVAGQLARSQGGDVLALQVVVIPEPVPLEAGRSKAQSERALMDQALQFAQEQELPISPVTRIARSVPQGILDTATEEEATLILLSWQGPIGAQGVSRGSTIDAVMRDAPCDILIMREDTAPSPGRILVPTAGGPHAQAATRLALMLAQTLGAQVTLLSVLPRPASARQMEDAQSRIAETLRDIPAEPAPTHKITQAVNVVEGIVQEAQEHDLVLLGVSEEGLLDQLVFGSIPLQVTARVPGTAWVQGYRGITGLWTRRLLRTLRGTLPTLSEEEQAETRREVSQGAQPGFNYFILIVLSCFIAALGLLLNSPAVVIGAMLIAPLMSPILAFSLGLVLGSLGLIRRAGEAILKGIALAIVISAFIGLLNPLKAITSEMHARARPTLLDLAVALVSGMAGAYAVARKDVSGALPGVAIAASLMPPLATVGLSLSLGDIPVAGGAFLLFVTNIAAISLAGSIVFLLLGIRPRSWDAVSRRQLRRRLFASFLLLLSIAVPLGYVTIGTIQDTTQTFAVETALIEHLSLENNQLVTLEIERTEAGLLISATVYSGSPIGQEEADHLAGLLTQQLGHPVRLEIVVLPLVRSQDGHNR